MVFCPRTGLQPYLDQLAEAAGLSPAFRRREHPNPFSIFGAPSGRKTGANQIQTLGWAKFPWPVGKTPG